MSLDIEAREIANELLELQENNSTWGTSIEQLLVALPNIE
jgi:hypothetical protein